MDSNGVLCITVITMGLVAFAIVKLGASYFDGVSRNPVINDHVKPMLLVLASMAELLGLVMMVIALYITFAK